LERRFARIQVAEPTPEEAEEILKGLRSRYEKHHGVEITDEALHAAVQLSIRYLNDRQLPDKAIDLMDESAAKVRLDKADQPSEINELRTEISQLITEKEEAIQNQSFESAARIRQKEKQVMEKLEELIAVKEKSLSGYSTQVTEEDVAGVVSQWTGVPLQQLEKKESERLMELETILHQRVVGQNEAVEAVSRAIRRARSGLKDPARPIGSFMFLGPTGIGKTELAKALAEAMFGSEEALIRVDMSEFIRQRPYSVILLDEVEKAHPDVFNILLQVLDDGHLTDAKGRKVDFRNTILIMTSNLGATAIREEKHVGFNVKDISKNHELMQKRIMEELKKAFRPEFLNRIDETVVFHSLKQEEIHEIVKIMSQSVVKRMAEQEVKVKITPAAIEVIGKVGFDPEYGARPIRRALQKEVEDRLSEALLSGQIQLGDKVTLGASKGKITLNVRAPKAPKTEAKELQTV